MLFDVQTARYLFEVTKLLTTPQPPDVIDPLRRYLTNRCPECGRTLDIFDLEHAVVSDGQDGANVYVVIGCERYHVINPNRVPGLASATWQDWTQPQEWDINHPTA